MDVIRTSRDYVGVPRNLLPTSVPILLGNILRERRRAMGLTQENLVAASGLDISFISRLERGLTTPSVGILLVLAEALGTSASKLTAELERLLIEKKSSRGGRVRSGSKDGKRNATSRE